MSHLDEKVDSFDRANLADEADHDVSGGNTQFLSYIRGLIEPIEIDRIMDHCLADRLWFGMDSYVLRYHCDQVGELHKRTRVVHDHVVVRDNRNPHQLGSN